MHTVCEVAGILLTAHRMIMAYSFAVDKMAARSTHVIDLEYLMFTARQGGKSNTDKVMKCVNW